jgi:hypothetical protein
MIRSHVVIRVFPRQTAWTPTDELAFVGNPPLFRPPEQAVCVSVTFSWDIEVGMRLYKAWGDHYEDVRIGGPAFSDPGMWFTPGQFVKPGVTFTSRGCVKRCPWCFAQQRERGIRTLPIVPGNNIGDNNLLACPRSHIEAVFDMLLEQKAIEFTGGLDATLLREWHVDGLKELSVKQMFFACDSPEAMPPLERSGELLADFPSYKKRCYVLMGFNGESLTDAEKRVERVYELGFYPFAMLFRDKTPRVWSKEWKALARKWMRPAAFKSEGEVELMENAY